MDTSNNSNVTGEEVEDQHDRIRSIIENVVEVRRVAMLEEIERSISERLEQKIESAMANLLAQLQVGQNNEVAPQPPNPQADVSQAQSLQQPIQPAASHTASPMTPRAFNRAIDSFQLNNMSHGLNSNKIGQIISSWNIKFDGSPKLSVDSFIYRLECQVTDTLGGNFNCVCEHIHILLLGDAKDWYWSYRRSVDRVTWYSFCHALRQSFDQHRTDSDVKELIRNRKQGQTETFDEYRNAIVRLMDDLRTPLREAEVVELIQRGLRPRLRQQLLYVQIPTVAELRRLCLKSKALYAEINKNNSNNTVGVRAPFKRNINELDLAVEDEEFEANQENIEIDEITRKSLVCWNCKQIGHRYVDCLEKRTVFCYGCGLENVYKPNCLKYTPGNGQRCETKHQLSRAAPQ